MHHVIIFGEVPPEELPYPGDIVSFKMKSDLTEWLDLNVALPHDNEHLKQSGFLKLKTGRTAIVIKGSIRIPKLKVFC